MFKLDYPSAHCGSPGRMDPGDPLYMADRRTWQNPAQYS